MNPLDLLRLIFGNLSRRKARVALTAIGVVIGTAAVVILVSLAIGLQRNASEQLYGIGDLRQIQVYPNLGGEGAPVQPGGKTPNQPKLLTNPVLEEIRALPGVSKVIPRDFLMAGLILRYKQLDGYASIIAVGTDDLRELGLEARQGETRLARGTLVIGPMAANNFYNPRLRPGQEPPPPPDLYGQTLQFIFIKYDSEGREIRKMALFKVTGILKETRGESDWSMYMRLDDAKPYNEWAQGRRINYNKDGYAQAVVVVEQVENALEVSKQITELGFQAYTPQAYLQGINNFYLILQVIFGGVGAIALLVAAIGIANTMTMAILERTREIGLMKAIGATNRDVLAIFLGEAAGIGFVGGLGGVVIGWLAGQGINVVALVYLANQTAQQGGMPPSVAVYTPLWLPLFALAFSTLIGLLSGLYPALRAATMVPVLALKYE